MRTRFLIQKGAAYLLDIDEDAKRIVTVATREHAVPFPRIVNAQIVINTLKSDGYDMEGCEIVADAR